jgi:hypothetical protein
MLGKHCQKLLGVVRQFEKLYGRKVEPGGMELPGLKALLQIVQAHLKIGKR